ncbi:hypothetical protein ABZ468_08180 [Streptomyces sp. NPDC005708]|uniref:hypothetical protein n=1 Tax=Streptomyces sp. NPDC005708 TaxID=3154564 RepID=UPI0033E73252
MDAIPAEGLHVPLTAAERRQVVRAAAAAGRTLEEFMRDAVLDAAADPFLMALELAADTIAARDHVQHDYAN